jgi:integrase
MKNYNPKNERIKRDYFRFQSEAGRKSDKTLDQIRKSLSRFEEYTKYKDFSTFNKEQAIAFKKYLAGQKNKRTGEPISKATVLSCLNALQEFFRWLAWQPGYKSRLHVPDIEYFNLFDKDMSIAKAKKHKAFPSMDQIRKVILSMPVETGIQRRNRALIAFTILTGIRDGALASLRLKHIDLSQTLPLVKQEPDMVKTKFSKSILTYFFPVGDDLQEIALDWIRELQENKLFSPTDPLFPQTKMGHDENQSFTVQGLEPVCWSDAAPIRKIFREAFESAGLPYFSPHRFRDTLVYIGQQVCKTPEQLKAWSMNLGHEKVLTTMISYSPLDPYRQGEVIKNISENNNERDPLALIIKKLDEMKI